MRRDRSDAYIGEINKEINDPGMQAYKQLIMVMIIVRKFNTVHYNSTAWVLAKRLMFTCMHIKTYTYTYITKIVFCAENY